MYPARDRYGNVNPRGALFAGQSMPVTDILKNLLWWSLVLVPPLLFGTYVVLNGIYDFGDGTSGEVDNDDDGSFVRWDELPPALIFPEQLHLTHVYYTDSYMTLRGLRTVSRDSRELLRSPAQYAGLGIGNTAWLGYREACGVPLSDFSGAGLDITLERLGTDAQNLSVTLFVFIDNDGNDVWDHHDCIAQVDAAVVPSMDLQTPGALASLDALASQPVWKSVSGFSCGTLPSHPGATGHTLDAANFNPFAKLFCGDTRDFRLPRRTPLMGVEWRIGHHDVSEFAEATSHRARFVVGTTQTTYNMDALSPA